MAEAFGTRLLKDIQTQSLNQLLSNLTGSLPISHNPTIPPLDFLRDLLQTPTTNIPIPGHTDHDSRHTAAALPSSPTPPSSPPPIPHLPPTHAEATYKSPPLIEILSSSTSNSRTHFLSILSSLLRPAHDKPPGLVIYLDCSSKLHIESVYSQLLYPGHDIARAQECLARLHVLRPENGRDVLSALRRVGQYLASLPERDVVLSAVVIADLSVFYWSERWGDERSRLDPVAAKGDVEGVSEKVYSRESLHTMIIDALKNVQRRWRCLGIVSGLGVPVATTGEAGEGVRSGLAKPWTRAVDVRIVLGSRDSGGNIEAKVDGRKWLASCGGRPNAGRGTFSISSSSSSTFTQINTFNHIP